MDVNPFSSLPCKQALYDPQFESDACGVGFVVNIDGIRSQKVSKFWFTVVLVMKQTQLGQ